MQKQTKSFIEDIDNNAIELKLFSFEPNDEPRDNLKAKTFKTKKSQLENSPKLKPVYHEASPSPLRLAVQALPDKFGGVSCSCPNSEDEAVISTEGANITYIKRIRKEFSKEKTQSKPPRLLSNDFIEKEKEESICEFIQEESVFFPNNNDNEDKRDERSNDEEEEDDDEDDGNEFILTLEEENKRYTNKTNSILQVLKTHSKQELIAFK